ncbi:MAG: SIMPL domain-containing protein, partial [Oscillospiraceae bacterium]|nr:SIMPL domain-containing protein [Oscillospiraceae bacterium]
MDRTITVKGSAKLSLRPDYVVITMNLTAEDKDYDTAMAQANERLDTLRDALAAVGYDRKELKTTNFNVSTEYDFQNDRNGNGRRVFRGYACSH